MTINHHGYESISLKATKITPDQYTYDDVLYEPYDIKYKEYGATFSYSWNYSYMTEAQLMQYIRGELDMHFNKTRESQFPHYTGGYEIRVDNTAAFQAKAVWKTVSPSGTSLLEETATIEWAYLDLTTREPILIEEGWRSTYTRPMNTMVKAGWYARVPMMVPKRRAI